MMQEWQHNCFIICKYVLSSTSSISIMKQKCPDYKQCTNNYQSRPNSIFNFALSALPPRLLNIFQIIFFLIKNDFRQNSYFIFNILSEWRLWYGVHSHTWWYSFFEGMALITSLVTLDYLPPSSCTLIFFCDILSFIFLFLK